MKLDQLICIGLSHQTAPVELRERLSNWPSDDLRTAAIQELVIISTCNRLELYAYMAESVEQPAQALIDLVVSTHTLPAAQLSHHLYIHQGEAMVRHLCRVAAGLESLVLGEAQILGQVNQAWQAAQRAKMVGPVLTAAFRIGVKAGKSARTKTKISANPVSVSSAALSLAQQTTGSLAQQRVLLVGLGEMGQLALKGLRARGVQQLSLANRSLERAQALAATGGGQVYPLAELPQAIQAADIVITATSAPEPIITVNDIANVMAQRPQRPLTLFDLAVPRDIEPMVGELAQVTLFDVDDLQQGVDQALAARRQEVPKVEALIDEFLLAWREQERELRARPVVVELRKKAEVIRQRAVERTLRHLGEEVDDQTADQLWHLSRVLVNQLLHEPTVQIKRNATRPLADEPTDATYTSLICDLFGLQPGQAQPHERQP